MNELETLVEMYKRSRDVAGQISKYKLQDVDLDVLEV